MELQFSHCYEDFLCVGKRIVLFLLMLVTRFGRAENFDSLSAEYLCDGLTSIFHSGAEENLDAAMQQAPDMFEETEEFKRDATEKLQVHSLFLASVSPRCFAVFFFHCNNNVDCFAQKGPFGRDVARRCALPATSVRNELLLRDVRRGAPRMAPIAHRFVPRSSAVLDKYSHQTFCGKFSKSGDLFMSACQDRHIRLYESDSWTVIKDITCRDVGWSIISVDYAPDDRWGIYSSWSNFVHLYNTRGAPVYEALNMRPSSDRFCLFSSEFSPNSTEILGGASDHW